MKDITELDRAELKHEMRSMYKQVGYAAALRCLQEIFVAANILMEVISEEIENEKN